MGVIDFFKVLEVLVKRVKWEKFSKEKEIVWEREEVLGIIYCEGVCVLSRRGK